MAGAPTGSAAGPDAWNRGIVLWDLAFLLAVAAALTFALGADDLSDGARLRAVVALVGLVGWYAAFGVRALHDRSTAIGLVYLAGMVPLFLFAFAQYESLGFLLFLLYIQPWTMTDRLGVAVLGDAVLAVGVGAVTLLVHHRSVSDTVAESAIALGFAVLFGCWIYGIIVQSVGRRTVIAELEQTRSELATVSHRAGVLAERERLAREIHDTVAQGFTSVVVLLELAESDVDTDPAAARQRLATARETARQNLAEARALVAALTPVDLQAAPLPEAIGRLVDRFGAETGLPARLTVAGEPRALPANIEVVLLRAAQEALANVRKHAGASRVEVILAGTAADGATDPGAEADTGTGTRAGIGTATGARTGTERDAGAGTGAGAGSGRAVDADPGTGGDAGAGTGAGARTGIVLTVADDGAGFDPAAPTGGYGLAGMRRRVEEIGGALSIHSGPGGTRVEVRC